MLWREGLAGRQNRRLTDQPAELGQAARGDGAGAGPGGLGEKGEGRGGNSWKFQEGPSQPAWHKAAVSRGGQGTRRVSGIRTGQAVTQAGSAPVLSPGVCPRVGGEGSP